MAHVSAEDAALFGGVITSMYRFHDMLLVDCSTSLDQIRQ